MAAVLHVRKGPESGLTFPIPDTAVTLVGRTSSNHIVLSSSSISACHCLIAPDEAGRGFVVIDARSRRGTHVNGRPITRSALRLGDAITIGPYELELAEASPDQPVNAARGERSRRPALFELRRAGSRGRGELLAPGPAKVLGRSRAADVRIGDPYASEYHCLIDLDSTESGVLPFVIDLYTSNKTHVSGRSIHRKHLRPGRTLAIGGAELTVRRLEVPVGRPEPRPAPRPAAPRRRQQVPVLTDADLAEPVPSHPTPVPAPGEDVPILTDRDLAEPPPAPGPAEGDALAPVDELPELPDLDLAESLAPSPAGEPAENAGARRTLEARAAPAEEEA